METRQRPAAQFRGDAVDGWLIGPTRPNRQAGFSNFLRQRWKNRMTRREFYEFKLFNTITYRNSKFYCTA
jgi:hypothetical protein